MESHVLLYQRDNIIELLIQVYEEFYKNNTLCTCDFCSFTIVRISIYAGKIWATLFLTLLKGYFFGLWLFE